MHLRKEKKKMWSTRQNNYFFEKLNGFWCLKDLLLWRFVLKFPTLLAGECVCVCVQEQECFIFTTVCCLHFFYYDNVFFAAQKKCWWIQARWCVWKIKKKNWTLERKKNTQIFMKNVKEKGVWVMRMWAMLVWFLCLMAFNYCGLINGKIFFLV